MDVNLLGLGRRNPQGLSNLFGNESAAVEKFNTKAQIMELLDYFESWLKNNEIHFDEREFDRMRSFLEELAKVSEANRKAREQLERDIIQMKKRLVQGMLDMIRGLNSRMFTKDSWRRAMRDVEKGARMYSGNLEPTRRQLDTVLRYLRSAIGKLEPARGDSARGRNRDREGALSRLKRAGEEGENELEKLGIKTSAPGSNIDVAVGGEVDVAASSVVVESV
ncbi:MAG: hypothetical protein FWE24_10855 [Defluviitaleaceae bacterium]|nr:hypothetical protein [Defluviitaleaceae bacterium]